MIISNQKEDFERIYITHCSAKKNEGYKISGELMLPENLYTSSKIQGFIEKCKLEKVNWAIFSDKYGVVFPKDNIRWYEKNPNYVSSIEYNKLLDDFIIKLSKYAEIWFYQNPSRFHNLYKRLLQDAEKEGLNIHLFSRKNEIYSETQNNNVKERKISPNRTVFYLETLPSGFQSMNSAIVEFSWDCDMAYICAYGLSENTFQDQLQITLLSMTYGRYKKINLNPKDNQSPKNYIYSIDVDSDKKYLLSGGLYGDLHLWDLHQTVELLYIENFEEFGAIHKIKFFPDKKKAVIGGEKGIFIFNIESNEIKKQSDEYFGFQNNISISNDGNYLSFSTKEKGLFIFNLEKEKLIFKKRLNKIFNGISYSPNSSLLFAGNEDGEVFIWNIQTGQRIAFWCHRVNSSFSDAYIIEGNSECQVKLHCNQGISVAVSNDMKRFASASQEGMSLIIYDLNEKRIIVNRDFNRKMINLKFSPEDKSINIGFRDGFVYVIGLKKR